MPILFGICAKARTVHTDGLLANDPALTLGRLRNGLRYALMNSGRPDGTATILLQVRTGALNETDAEQGAAHLIEHLAFGASAHFPSGTMISRLKEISPRSTNVHVVASPGLEVSSYKLDLVDTHEETIATGLDMVADWAGGLSLEQAEIDRQRGTVLAEIKHTDTVDDHMRESVEAARYAGMIAGDRTALGLPNSVATLDRDALKSFYDRWYRPEAMLVVVVGAIDATAVARQIERSLGSIAGRAASGGRPDAGKLKTGGAPILLMRADPLAAATDVVVERTAADAGPAPGTAASERNAILWGLAEGVFRSRVEAMVARDAALPVANAEIYNLRGMGLSTSGLRVSVKSAAHATAAMEVALAEYRRLLEFGPTQAEMAFERESIEAELDASVRQSGERDNASLAEEIARCDRTGRVFQSPAQRRDLLRPMLASFGSEDIVGLFREVEKGSGRRLIAVTGRENLGGDGARAVLAAYTRGMNAQATPLPASSVNRWAYGDLADASGMYWMTERPDEAEAGIHVLWSHPNGLRMQVRPSKAEPGEVLVSLRFDIGDGEVKTHRPAGVGEWIERGLVPGGLGRHTAAEVESLFSDSTVQFTGVHVSDDAVTYTARCNNRDLSRTLQLLRAYYGDPGWRQDAERQVKKAWLDDLVLRQQDVTAEVDRRVSTLLAGPYAWRRQATMAEVQALQLSDVQEWLGRALHNATLTVSVAGDVDDRAAEVLVQWFGQYRVKARFMQASIENARASAIDPIPVHAGVERVAVGTSEAQAEVHVAWRTNDIFDEHRGSVLKVLAQCLEERIENGLRQRYGATAGARAWNVSSESIRDAGELHVVVRVAAAHADEGLAMVRAAAAGNFDAASVQRMKALVATKQRQEKRENEWWLSHVMPYAGWQPFRIAWAAHAEMELESTTAEELNALARSYLVDSRMVAVVGIPLQRTLPVDAGRVSHEELPHSDLSRAR